MMKPVFDENGLAIATGTLRVFYFEPVTREYMGWSDEYINIGVSMPGSSTAIDPGEGEVGEVFMFSGSEWVPTEDHRGETAYDISNGQPATVDYIGALREGFTFDTPSTQFDKWNDGKWVADEEAQHAFDVVSAESRQQLLITEANAYMNSKQWPGKAAIGRLKDSEKAEYNAWLDYLDALEAVDTSNVPVIAWPERPDQ